jgi:hypothetical protein
MTLELKWKAYELSAAPHPGQRSCLSERGLRQFFETMHQTPEQSWHPVWLP